MWVKNDGIPPSMTKYFQEELEAAMQGETKLFSFRPYWSIFNMGHVV